MPAERYVLDTSALLTLMEDEDGAQRVEEVLRSAVALLPCIVLMEVYYIVRQERGEAEATRRYALARELPLTVIWELDEPTILLAGRLKADHRLSLADAVIAATAVRQQATLLHKDPEFEAVTAELRQEALPYKAAPGPR